MMAIRQRWQYWIVAQNFLQIRVTFPLANFLEHLRRFRVDATRPDQYSPRCDGR